MIVVARRIHHFFAPPGVKYTVHVRARFLGFKNILQSCRNFSQGTEDYVKLKSKEFHVNPGFGILRTTGNVDCIIKPTNPQEYPDADRAFVSIYGKEVSQCASVNVELVGESRDVLMLTAFPDSPLMYCEVQIPIKYNLDIKLLNGAGVQISGMEADEVNIDTVVGNIKTRGLKSHNIHIKTKTGNITAEGVLQGNLFIDAKKTSISAKRLQGMAMSIDAEELNTSIESSYITQGEIKANSGNIILKNLHGCTDLVLRNGEVSISGLHGQIAGFLGRGNMDVQVTEVTCNSTLHVKEGTMNISVLENPRHDLEVSAPVIEMDSDLKSKGIISTNVNQTYSLSRSENPETNKLIATVVKGIVRLKYQDWFSTLGIKQS